MRFLKVLALSLLLTIVLVSCDAKIEPIEPTKPIKPIKPVKPINPGGRIKSIETIKSIESIKSIEPIKSINSPSVSAPQPPGSEIMLFDYQLNKHGEFVLSNGKNITQSHGYDSQPRFSADGQTIYYSHFVDDQMDIYQYDLSSGKNSAYMSTQESEYSPTPMPDEAGLSVVQVDAAGDQYIVLLNAEAEANKQMKSYSDLKQVGYFNWTIGGDNWSFVLNDSEGGDLYHMGQDKKPRLISSNVGRTFVTDASQKLIYFVDKNTTPWRIKSRESHSTEAKDIMTLPKGVEDFSLDSQGRFWAGRGNTLFVSDDQMRWYIVHEFNQPNLDQISRLTTNSEANKIAIVFAEKSSSE